MADQAPIPPVDPLRAALEPFGRTIRTVWTFYWDMAWRPRPFGEQHIRTPEVTSIKRAAKHFFWLVTFFSAMNTFLYDFGKFLGQKPAPIEISKFYLTFIFSSMAFAQAVPMAAMLSLFTRRYALGFSRALLIFMHTFNLFIGATILLLLAMVLVEVPFEFYGYLTGAIPASFDPNNPPDLDNPLFRSLMILSIPVFGVFLYISYRGFIVVPAELIAGAVNLKFWQALWRYGLSVIVVIIPLEFLLFTLMWFFGPMIASRVVLP